MISLRNIEKFFQHGPSKSFVLRRVNLEIREGEFLSIMGPSGAGKSTLLHLIGMHDSDWTGECHLLDQRRSRPPQTRPQRALQDIPPLAGHFLKTHTQRYRKPITGFDSPALNALMENRWQGNVRELNHVIERAVLLAQDSQIRLADLALRTNPGVVPRLEEMSLEEVESHLIRKALHRYQGNVSQAAHALGLSRSALYRRLQRYGL